MVNNKFKELQIQLTNFLELYKQLSVARIPRDVLLSYICFKTKMSKGMVQRILDCQEKFYDEFMLEQAEEAL